MKLQLRADVATTATEHGTVLLDERTGRYWQLNPTGTRVLHDLLAGRDPEQIAADFATTYDLTLDKARRDVTTITDQLQAATLTVRT
ncbi:lasso peptide biosynthesis PqqD family chaperone [Streptomyces sp. NPDC018000]|uniref:lasso peptide biosynthesis PqqD family chaperone n=1 Tax=Streptomyces sp. NPDC018000 TaxID=3365028 RepID=UPI0037B63002